MSDNTIISQGSFTSTGVSVLLNLRQDVDWVEVINMTQSDALNDSGVLFKWQRGMAPGQGWELKKFGGADSVEVDVIDTGFVLFDTSADPVGPLTATVTAVSNANPPRVTVGSTAGLMNGNIVRMAEVVNGQQLGGLDFTINVIDGTHFDLIFMVPIVATGATTGAFIPIAFDPIFYPRRRFITNITQAAQAVVTLSVTHGYTVGQAVRFVVPKEYGMTQINGLLGDITAIDTVNNRITVDINTTAFTAFAFPLSGALKTQAQVVPVGDDTALANANMVSSLSDATLNTAEIGIALGAGANAPAGVNNDVIFWKAGKSFSVNNV